MDKKEYYDSCEKCGRPFRYAQTPKCHYNTCCLNEYHHTMPACIRNKQPDCTAKAVIPSVTVETTDGITNLANCFVHVTSINTTFYIDDKHRPMIVWAGQVEVDLPADVQTAEQWDEFIRSYNLKSQFLYVKFTDTDTHRKMVDAFYFDRTGTQYFAGQFEEITEA